MSMKKRGAVYSVVALMLCVAVYLNWSYNRQEEEGYQSVAEFKAEGDAMHHCVFGNAYYDVKKHPHSLILSAKDNEGHRLETTELNTKTWKVMQSRALQNGKTKFHNEIVKLVEQNIGLFKKVA